MNDDKVRHDILAADPQFAERLRRHEEHLEQVSRAAEPLFADLSDVGVRTGSFRELREPGSHLSLAVPVLVKWLTTVENETVKREVIRTLGDRRAGVDAARALIDEFRRVDPALDSNEMTSIRSAIASALFSGATDAVASELTTLAAERIHGGHRSLVLLALGRLKKSRSVVIPVLVAQLDDDSVADCAIQALVKLQAAEISGEIARLADHPKASIRSEVRKALRRFGSQPQIGTT